MKLQNQILKDVAVFFGNSFTLVPSQGRTRCPAGAAPLAARAPAVPPRKGVASQLGGLGLLHCEGSGKFDRARSRLYRGQILQEYMRLKALAEIYTSWE